MDEANFAQPVTLGFHGRHTFSPHSLSPINACSDVASWIRCRSKHSTAGLLASSTTIWFSQILSMIVFDVFINTRPSQVEFIFSFPVLLAVLTGNAHLHMNRRHSSPRFWGAISCHTGHRHEKSVSNHVVDRAFQHNHIQGTSM